MPAGRGPRATTRANPAGLTERQLDVLELLSEGLTNAQIAERLVLSVRTVDHHVAAVLDKLDVPSRHDAAAAAHGRASRLLDAEPDRAGREAGAVDRVLAAAGVDGERVERPLGMGDVDRRREAGEAAVVTLPATVIASRAVGPGHLHAIRLAVAARAAEEGARLTSTRSPGCR